MVEIEGTIQNSKDGNSALFRIRAWSAWMAHRRLTALIGRLFPGGVIGETIQIRAKR